MSLSAAWSLYYNDGDFIPILQSIVTTISFGIILVLFFRNKEKKELTTRDGFAIVTLGWISMAIFSALQTKSAVIRLLIA